MEFQQDKENLLDRVRSLVKENPNDYSLGAKIRELFLKSDGELKK